MSSQTEALEKRINQLTQQNTNFKKLLYLAKDIGFKTSLGLTKLTDETKFIKQTLFFLNKDRKKIEEDVASKLSIVSSVGNRLHDVPQSDISKKIAMLETENIHTRKNLILLLDRLKKDAIEMEQLKSDHRMLKKILLKQKTNSFMGILQVPGESIRVPKLLHIEEAKEKIRLYLLNRVAHKHGDQARKSIDSITCDKSDSEVGLQEIQSQINVIKQQVEKEYLIALGHGISAEIPEASIILELEKERTNLLNQLQLVLEDSTKQIADEYCKLQNKILNLENEKDSLQKEVDLVLNNSEKTVSCKNSLQSTENLKKFEVEKEPEAPKIEKYVSSSLKKFSETPSYAEESKMFQNVSHCCIL